MNDVGRYYEVPKPYSNLAKPCSDQSASTEISVRPQLLSLKLSPKRSDAIGTSISPESLLHHSNSSKLNLVDALSRNIVYA